MAKPFTPLRARLFSRIKKTDTCWIWLGQRDANGYGKIGSGGRNGKNIPTHRAVYEFMVGPIPQGLQLDHLCRNPICCNPAHLEPVTPAENIRRGAPARRTHCIHGHAFTLDNTYRWPKVGRRRCKTCNSLAHAAYYARNRDRINAERRAA